MHWWPFGSKKESREIQKFRDDVTTIFNESIIDLNKSLSKNYLDYEFLPKSGPRLTALLKNTTLRFVIEVTANFEIILEIIESGKLKRSFTLPIGHNYEKKELEKAKASIISNILGYIRKTRTIFR